MPAPLPLREDFTAEAVRQLAKRSRDAKHSRRLLAFAAVYGGMGRDGSPDGARLGDPIQCARAGRPFRQQVGWSEAPTE